MADIIPGVAVQLPNMMDVIWWMSFIIQMAMVIGIVGVATWYIMTRKVFAKFPVKVDIFQVKNGVLQAVDTDKARRIKKKDGEEYYDFKKRKKLKWHPPTFEALLQGQKSTSHLYLKELSQDEFEIINPSSFVTGRPEEYASVEKEGNVRFWKNLEENKAKFKWNKEGKWDKVIAMLPVLLLLVGLGLFFSFTLPPISQAYMSFNSQGSQMLQQSVDLLNKSTEYVELLMRLNGVNSTSGIVRTVNGTVIR